MGSPGLLNSSLSLFGYSVALWLFLLLFFWGIAGYYIGDSPLYPRAPKISQGSHSWWNKTALVRSTIRPSVTSRVPTAGSPGDRSVEECPRLQDVPPLLPKPSNIRCIDLISSGGFSVCAHMCAFCFPFVKLWLLNYALVAEISNLLSWQNFKLQSSLVTVMVTIFYANLRGRVRVYDSINAFVVVKTTEEWGIKACLMSGEHSSFPSISYKFKRTIINRIDNITEGKKL